MHAAALSRSQPLLSSPPAAARSLTARRQGASSSRPGGLRPLRPPTAFHAAVALPAQPDHNGVPAMAGGQLKKQLQQQAPSWLSDEWKEEHRTACRTVFDHERWRLHRSSSRYWRHMLGMLQSSMLQGLAKPLLFVVGASLAVGAYHAAAARGLVPLLPALRILASQPFGLTSFALSLLLVFRTNTSYGRFDEARKLWGTVVNRSRDIVRQGLAYIPPSQAHLQDLVCRWTLAYNRSLLCHLREGEDLQRQLAGILPPAELAALLAAAHRPLYCLQVLSAVVRKAQLPGGSFHEGHSAAASAAATAAAPAGAAYRMDENITAFGDACGACERLLRTPIPLGYTRHTSRFLMLWLTLLPLSLWATCGWATVPVAALVAFLLLGVDEIGVQIEEPFSILPLERICDTIQGNIEELRATYGVGAAGAATVESWLEAPAQGAHALKPDQGWGSNVVAAPAALHASLPGAAPAGVPSRPGGRGRSV